MKSITPVLLFVSFFGYSQVDTQRVKNPLLALEGMGCSRPILMSSIIKTDPSMTNTLYVLNGVPQHKNIFETLNPSDIESISILKDPDATFIYGKMGINGAVLITTKKRHKIWKHWLWPIPKITVHKNMTGHRFRKKTRIESRLNKSTLIHYQY